MKERERREKETRERKGEKGNRNKRGKEGVTWDSREWSEHAWEEGRGTVMTMRKVGG